MRSSARWLCVLALLGITSAAPLWASRIHAARGPGVSASLATHVKGYTRKDGTYVRPHERRSSGPTSPRHVARSYRTRSASPSHIGADGLARDAHGRIQRSEAAKHEFMKRTGYPHGRPGYVVDHIVPLALGGADDPSNMQWQTIEEAKRKDKVELGPHPRGGGRHPSQ